MKKVSFALILLFLLFACDSKQSYDVRRNQTPVMGFSELDKHFEYSDSRQIISNNIERLK